MWLGFEKILLEILTIKCIVDYAMVLVVWLGIG
nr:MAG TPA: hypothetical protein [Siphoviridae sp. ctHdl3]